MMQASDPFSIESNGLFPLQKSPIDYLAAQRSSRNIWIAWALLVAGLLLTGISAWYVKRGVETTARRDFIFACEDIKNKISARLQGHAQLLRSGAAFFEKEGGITRSEWANLISRQKIDIYFPGIQGIGYSIIVRPDQLSRHEQSIRKEGFPQYAIKPAGRRDIYTSIIYLEPFAGRNLRAFGFDMFSEPVRRYAMEHARDNDEAALSGKITLVQETEKDVQAGALMYVPVYETGMLCTTVEQRRKAIRGWVYSPYRMNDLMSGILGGWERGEGRRIRLQVYDDASYQPDALLYDSWREQTNEIPSSSTCGTHEGKIQ